MGWQGVHSSKSMILVCTFLLFSPKGLVLMVLNFWVCVLSISVKRRAEAARIREKYPDRIPVRVHLHDLLQLNGCFLISFSASLLCSYFWFWLFMMISQKSLQILGYSFIELSWIWPLFLGCNLVYTVVYTHYKICNCICAWWMFQGELPYAVWIP